MRIFLTTTLFLCVIITCHSQELKKVTHKSQKPSVIEDYYVLKKEKDIKHGSYQKMTYRGLVLEKGFYKENKRDSLWIYFASNGTDTSSYGYYIDDKQIGKWKTFDNKGVFSFVYDYSKGGVTKYNWNDESRKFLILTDEGWVEDEIDSPPLVLEGEKPLNVIARNLRYPTRAWRSGIDGLVEVAFIVDSTGRMGNYRIKDGTDPDLDAEALRVVEILDIIWYPAQKDGKPITIEYFLPVKFTLRK